MRNLLCFILIPLIGALTYGQNKQILYDFGDIPQSLLVNPSTTMEQDYHVGIPFLSQFSFHFGSSGVSAYDIFGSSSVDINTRIQNIIYGMKSTDFFSVNQQLELLSFGWKNPKGIYFSGGIYQELDIFTYFPKDWAVLAWDGNRDYLEREFDFNDISLTAELLSVFHFGANKQINEKLTLGVRGKIYSSIAHARSVNNGGVFVTKEVEGSDNIYQHQIIGANVTVETSGIQTLSEANSSAEVMNKVIKRAFLGGNLGLGFDLGATYKINRKFTATASLIDLGAVFHKNDAESYVARGNHTLDGIELLFPPLSGGQSTFDYYDDVENNFEDDIPLDTINSSYTQFRPLKVNASIKYGFGRSQNAKVCDCLNKDDGDGFREEVGMQLFAIKRPKRLQLAVTAFYKRRFGNFITGKLTYTVDSYSSSNLGMGLSTNFNWFNFYIAVDNILKYQNVAKAKNVSLQLGFNLKIDKNE
ncbi:MAG: hypothetical protein ACI9SJ_000107 [Flavobacteriaceae bacterium]|jgi:hypothetical protein|uniref:DUF5723 family protein n=1 Tax=Candidatus Marifrigoribacter sp. Uisw_064 TaxID=3230970 RepID=UPI003AE9721C